MIFCGPDSVYFSIQHNAQKPTDLKNSVHGGRYNFADGGGKQGSQNTIFRKVDVILVVSETPKLAKTDDCNIFGFPDLCEIGVKFCVNIAPQ